MGVQTLKVKGCFSENSHGVEDLNPIHPPIANVHQAISATRTQCTVGAPRCLLLRRSCNFHWRRIVPGLVNPRCENYCALFLCMAVGDINVAVMRSNPISDTRKNCDGLELKVRSMTVPSEEVENPALSDLRKSSRPSCEYSCTMPSSDPSSHNMTSRSIAQPCKSLGRRFAIPRS